MTRSFTDIERELSQKPRRWLVTGAAGFIGSHLCETLLALGQRVTGFDDFSSGSAANLQGFKAHKQFSLIEGDVRDADACREACSNVDYVLHHAAIGSVVKSLEDPALVDAVNGGGFINVLLAASGAGAQRVVYASSSAVYGDGGDAPRHEGETPGPLSPYAVTKCANELYATTLARTHGIASTGLRYFNIFGPRQDPQGAYAAVIPRWTQQMLAGAPVEIYGDGRTVRDFCYVGDAVQANIRAALAEGAAASPVYNIAAGKGTTLNELFAQLKTLTGYKAEPLYRDFRAADIRMSCAAIDNAVREIGFEPVTSFADGLARTVDWYRSGTHG